MLALLAGCTSPQGSYQSFQRSDKILYSELAKRAFQYEGPARNPVVVVPGLLGSRLKNNATGQMVWGNFTGSGASMNELCSLSYPMEKSKALRELQDSVEPAGIMDRANVQVMGFSFTLPGYDALLDNLRKAGYVDDPAVLKERNCPQSLFTFAYDWRRDVSENAARLDLFIRAKRAELQKEYERIYGLKNYDVHFDVVGHSLGGLVSRYYLMYGNQVLDTDNKTLPRLNWAGNEFVDKLVIVGTPNDGYMDTFYEMVNGLELVPGAPVYPSGVIASFPVYYQMLPGINGGKVYYPDSPGTALDLFAASTWIDHNWGLADPANDQYLQVLLPEIKTFEERRQIALEHLEKNLAKARQLRQALAVPCKAPASLDLYLFAADAFETTSAIEVDPLTNQIKIAAYASGDGKVAIASARFDRVDPNFALPFSESPIPWRAVTHVRAAHMGLLISPEFLSNARYDLLMVPSLNQKRKFLQ